VRVYLRSQAPITEIWALPEVSRTEKCILGDDFWIVYFASAFPAAYWRSFRQSNRFRSDYRNDYDFTGLFRLTFCPEL
jgi:hypothetical protein